MPIQQMLLGGGAAVATKTYIEDIFSTNVWIGNDAIRTISPGFDLSSSGDGGLVWIKARSRSDDNVLGGSWLGDNKYLRSNVSNAREQNQTGRLKTVTSSGFQLGTDDVVNQSPHTYASWCFKNTDNFFKIVQWTGDGSSNRQINHGLGSVPGMIIVKTIDASYEWQVFHRAIGETKGLVLDNTNSAATKDWWNDTAPNATNFTVGGSSTETNDNGLSYVAYVFAGGESTAATARSVDFDRSGDYLSLASSSDFAFGTGDFTIECWAKAKDSNDFAGVFNLSTTSGGFGNMYEMSLEHASGVWRMTYGDNGSNFGTNVSSSSKASIGVWTHLAYVRSSGVTKLYVNGIEEISVTDTTDYQRTNLAIGGMYSTDYLWEGEISNFRVVKGTAVYTSSFRPPTEPLTNITNTKLLCCNNSSTTGSTVTPGTITANGDPTASTDSPFDDPAGFAFGDAGDQNVIKCGSYKGNNNSDGPEVNLGFEPSFLILKESSDNGNHWRMYDSMRGIAASDNDAELYPSSNGEEDPNNEFLELTPTGFKLKTSDSAVNDNQTYIYLAVRRSDGYVGKPVELGTDVFAMDTGNSSSTIPTFDSGFPVDFAMVRANDSSNNWETCARLIGRKYLTANTNGIANSGGVVFTWDSNVGWLSHSSYDSTQLSWMWKRHAGFDVVTYPIVASGGIRHQKHSLGKVPEMIWMKDRDNADPFIIYHKGLNGGTNPKDYYLTLNSNNSESNLSNFWGNSASDINATSFYIDQQYRYGGGHIALLFASVDGISKVGYFDGQDSTITISTGFAPRFLIIKRITGADGWLVFDTTRGWGSGNDYRLMLDSSTSQSAPVDYGAPTSTGFTMTTRDATNASGEKYIYYAHS